MSTVLGIDPASNRFSVVAVWDSSAGTKMRMKTFKVTPKFIPGESPAKLYDALVEFLGSLPMDGGKKFCYLESPVVGVGGIKSTMVQAFASGALQAALVHCGFSIYLVNNTTWKKVVCGNGGASKEAICKVVTTTLPSHALPLFAGDGDLIDAAAIALYGVRVSETAMALGEGLAKRRKVPGAKHR